MKILTLLCSMILALNTGSARAAEIKVAAAADLKFALDAIIEKYRSQNPSEKVTVVYGASGNFVTQIEAGAPFDVFLSADTEKAQELIRAAKTSGPSFPYAHGHLVLWVRNASQIKLDAQMNCLGEAGAQKIAVANAKSAPYGKLAEGALKKAGLFAKVQSKLVIGENISQTAQFVESSAADIGLIAKSLALSPVLQKEGRYLDVDPTLYIPLEQSGVLIRGPHLGPAAKFKTYFLGHESQQILLSYGLTP